MLCEERGVFEATSRFSASSYTRWEDLGRIGVEAITVRQAMWKAASSIKALWKFHYSDVNKRAQ